MQQEAVNAINGQILVISCPGSGKTTVIIERCRKMVESGILPSSMLNITFTKSSATEMEKRYISTYGNDGICFSTIHSFCYTILKQEYHYAAADILKESEKWSYIAQQLYRKIAPCEMEETVKNVMSEISYVKNMEYPIELFCPQSCDRLLFTQIYNSYEDSKRQMKKIDFDDMLVQCKDLFQSQPYVLEKWKNIYRYITIDEYQDVNKVQAEIFYLLTGKDGNLFVVGDDDQSIYRFRAADSTIMLSFPQKFPNCHIINMGINYRSGKNIVSAAGRLIKNNQQRFSKDFDAFREDEGNIYLMKSKSSTDEAHVICNKLEQLSKDGVPFNNMAILFRTNTESIPFITELMKRNLPFYTTEQAKSIHDDPIYHDIIAYYRLSQGICNKGDLQRIINKPSRYLKTDYFKDCKFDRRELLNACNSILDEKKRENAKSKIIDLIFDIESLKDSTPEKLIKRICSFGYRNWLKDYAAYRGKTPDEMYTVLDNLLNEATGFDSMEDYLIYVDKYEKRLQEIRKAKNKSGICLSTFHASKGLEWNHVFVISVNEDITPFQKAETIIELEEERRMFYVAITRAKDSLYLSYLDNLKPSYYLYEMGVLKHENSLTVSGDSSRKLSPLTGLG